VDRYYRALDKVRPLVLALPNVIGVGMGYKRVGDVATGEPSIVVFVEKKIPSPGLARGCNVPPQIDGLDTDVVEIGPVRLLAERNGKMRPALPGCSVAHYKVGAGTFGAVVKDQKTGVKLILSNNHVLANQSNGKDNRAKAGDPILQPGSNDGGRDGDKIAVLERFVPLQQNTDQQSPHNLVDCAVAKPVNPDAIGENIIDIGKVSGVEKARNGMKVRKSGRTTGLGSGEVSATGVTIKVDLSPKISAWFSDQVVANLKCKAGDSGSLVVDRNNHAVGLLFAGSDNHCIFNRIENVLNLLAVKF